MNDVLLVRCLHFLLPVLPMLVLVPVLTVQLLTVSLSFAVSYNSLFLELCSIPKAVEKEQR